MTRYPMLTYRKATTDDAGNIIAILDEVAAWLMTRGIVQWYPGDFVDNVHDGIAKGEIHLALQDGAIVGTFRLQSSDPRIWGDVEDNAFYVHRLAVTRSVAGQGVGVAMLREAERMAQEAGKVYLRLDCQGNNFPLVAYYERAGFMLVGKVMLGSWNCALLERRVGWPSPPTPPPSAKNEQGEGG